MDKEDKAALARNLNWLDEKVESDNKYNVPKLDKTDKGYTPEIRLSDPLIGTMRWNWTTVSWEVVTDDYRIARGKALLESLPIQDRMDIEFYLDGQAGP